MAAKKPQGIWDDLVYPVAKYVLKKGVKSGVVKNTTRVSTNRAILDKATVAKTARQTGRSKASAKKDLSNARAKTREANAQQKNIRSREKSLAKLRADRDPLTNTPYDRSGRILKEGKRLGVAKGASASRAAKSTSQRRIK